MIARIDSIEEERNRFLLFSKDGEIRYVRVVCHQKEDISERDRIEIEGD